jgi:hypothetical protein
VLEVEVRTRSTYAPGLRLVLLAILLLMALMADTRVASAAPTAANSAVGPPAAGQSPFDRHGMWIWYVDRSDGGNVDRIVARAQRAGIGTLYIKAGDAGSVWSQFNKPLVGALHGGGLSVCAWQFVYGDSPVAEAKVGAAAVRRGADCLVIDAEGQYEGKYASADRYVRNLRARIGATFPLSLAAFPYVDYHPSFPYSVFLGPEGATVNQPQMYWRAPSTSTPSSSTGSGGARSIRSGRPTAGRGAATSSASGASPRAMAAWRRAGGTGRRRAAPAGERWAPKSPGRCSATARSTRTRC